MNPHQSIVKIEKVTLNFGAGKDQTRLEKGVSLIEAIAGIKPVRTITKKRIPAWGLRPGLPVGAKLTLRSQAAATMLKRLLAAKDFELKHSNIDQQGNISFGIPEYIDIEGAAYDPAIGILGLEVAVTLCKAGHRVKLRAIKSSTIGKRQHVTKQESMQFLTNTFNVKFGDAP